MLTFKMKIKHVNGSYWNADQDCFGPMQAATEYKSLFDLPGVIECDDTTHCEISQFARYDVRYYPTDDMDANAVASVEHFLK